MTVTQQVQSATEGSAARTPSSPRRGKASARTAKRGPTSRDEYIHRVREALAADYLDLSASPLCELPQVIELARTTYSRKIFPEASALRALLNQAYEAALVELDGVEDRRLQRVATYLRLVREGVPKGEITHHLGFHSRSHMHTAIERQALELVTEAFIQRARRHAGGAPLAEA